MGNRLSALAEPQQEFVEVTSWEADIDLAIGGPSYAGSGDGFAMSRNTIDGGGVMRATGGDFELSGTMGQPDAGRMTGGEFDLSGGFWFELVSGDCAEDGGVSTGDVLVFADCLSGPSAVTQGECSCGDFDGDGDTDLHDVAEFQISFVAP